MVESTSGIGNVEAARAALATRVPSTPFRMTGAVRRFIESIGASAAGVYLPLAPVDPDFRSGYSFSNVEAEVRRRGGEAVFGWLVWELKAALYLEAQFHSVACRHGALLDVTPRQDGERTVLFVRDPRRRARRVSPTRWESWSNVKRIGPMREDARPIILQDDLPNEWRF